MSKVYAGVGSRETPFDVQALMTRFARWAQDQGWVLRSGNARGADQAFGRGAGKQCELYLPWWNYNKTEKGDGQVIMSQPSLEAIELASQFHLAWERCSQGVRKMHGRNAHIVLGPRLDHPVDFLVCWTPRGATVGGTGETIKIAQAADVQVINLGEHTTIDEMRRRLFCSVVNPDPPAEPDPETPPGEGMSVDTPRQRPTEIFVFGSNLAGIHGAGAAKHAQQEYGALYGVGQGRTGDSYAIPTKDARIRTLPLDTIALHVRAFIAYAERHPELRFLLTRVGCGLAGYEDRQIAPMFRDCPDNVQFPDKWEEFPRLTARSD